jgi:hypothetical protein
MVILEALVGVVQRAETLIKGMGRAFRWGDEAHDSDRGDHYNKRRQQQLDLRHYLLGVSLPRLMLLLLLC